MREDLKVLLEKKTGQPREVSSLYKFTKSATVTPCSSRVSILPNRQQSLVLLRTAR
jgi:hypothetical protein